MPIVICVFALSACAQETVNQSGISVEEENSESEVGVSANEDTTVVSDEGDSSVSIEDTLYSRFLENKEQVLIKNSNNNEEYFPIDTMNLCGNEYYIEDLVDEIYEFYDLNTDDKIVEYAYLDCGNDGIEELAVRITVPVGDQTEYFIIKEIGGQLETIYSVDAWPRRRVVIGQYGFIALEASGGAAGTFFSKSYVDESGKLHYLFTCNDSGRMDIYAVLIGDVGMSEDEALNCSFFGFNFDNTIDYESYDVCTYAFTREDYGYRDSHFMTTYSNFPILYDESIYEESNPVRKHLENIGLTVLSINGIEAVLEEIENKAGVTKEIKNGKNVTWNRWQR